MKTKELSIFEETSLGYNGNPIFLRAKGANFGEALENAELVAVDKENYTVKTWPLSAETDSFIRSVMGTFTAAWLAAEESALDEELSLTGTEC